MWTNIHLERRFHHGPLPNKKGPVESQGDQDRLVLAEIGPSSEGRPLQGGAAQSVQRKLSDRGGTARADKANPLRFLR